jgi:hypothetical protein
MGAKGAGSHDIFEIQPSAGASRNLHHLMMKEIALSTQVHYNIHLRHIT